MSYTWGNLKAELRPEIFPTGEAPNLVASHDRFFLQAIIDLQQAVDCLQYDNTSLFPQCSTYFQCGLTVLPAPRGNILSVSVIDKINQTTGREDATADDDYCSPIEYVRIDHCHIRSFLHHAIRSRGCCDIPSFFGLGNFGKGRFPKPTQVVGLPTLPLGYFAATASTDSPHGRARRGIWSMDRGNLFIAPWIQSTETVIIKWDGVKRPWLDNDPFDNDPQLKEAIAEYVRWKHAGTYDKEVEEENRALSAYNTAVQWLMHACREETRQRGCEGSKARASGFSTDTAVTPLFFNTQQQATASCADGQTGNPVTITIPANTISSTISVADANAKALNEAQQQANAQLDCTSSADVFTNDAQSFTAQCATSETGAPAPDGNPVTITIPAGTYTSTISKVDANEQAFQAAQQQATAQLQCTFWNSKQSYTANCPQGSSGAPVTITIAAHSYSSTISQADADQKAVDAAKSQAEAQITCTNVNTFFNTLQHAIVQKLCILPGGQQCTIVVTVYCLPNKFTSLISQADANQQAITAAQGHAQLLANQKCSLHDCGNFTDTI